MSAGMDSIVVKEILDRADVGRSGFYTHFSDKDDLLTHGIYDILGGLRNTATEHKNHAREASPVRQARSPTLDDGIGRRGSIRFHNASGTSTQAM